MNIISKEQFLELAKEKRDICITVYMPTHRAGFEVNEKQDWLQYKNILKDVEREVLASGMKKGEAEQLLRPAFELLDDHGFWYNLDQSLALFITVDSFLMFRLPTSIKQEIYINNSFYLSPIYYLVDSNRYFYILTISKNAALCYVATAFSIKELSIDGLPRGMNDVIHFEEKSGRRLFRAGGSPAMGIGSAHGHDAGLAEEDEYLAAYLKEVDQTLWKEKLGNESAPLLLAGVGNIVAKFKDISRYGNIMPAHLAGNYERIDAHALLEKSKGIMTAYLQAPLEQALRNYFNNLGTGTSCSDFSKIIKASHFGQVQDLFVKEQSHLWGRFDTNQHQAILHKEREYGDECLLNLAVSQTIQNGGNIYVLTEDIMPERKIVAANLRY